MLTDGGKRREPAVIAVQRPAFETTAGLAVIAAGPTAVANFGSDERKLRLASVPTFPA